MGKPNIRLNPQIDSIRNRVLLERGILLRKKYADYETEMRFDKRLMEMLKLDRLPCKKLIEAWVSNVDGKGISYWPNLFKLWKIFPSLCEGIYNQRSKIEAVFSALKNRYGDQLHSKRWFMRRREMAMRFIAYNVRIIIGMQIAREKNIPL